MVVGTITRKSGDLRGRRRLALLKGSLGKFGTGRRLASEHAVVIARLIPDATRICEGA